MAINKDKITAEWARKTSQEVLGVKIEGEVDNCLDAIVLAVNKNENGCSVDFYADKLTIKELEKRGFKASSHSDQRDGSWTQIKW